jgi:hypothetical protein
MVTSYNPVCTELLNLRFLFCYLSYCHYASLPSLASPPANPLHTVALALLSLPNRFLEELNVALRPSQTINVI